MQNQIENMPQVGFKHYAPAIKGTRKSRKESRLPFEMFLRNWAEYIRTEQLKLRKLVEMSVELRRRYRGLSLSDLWSGYGTRRTTQGIYLEYDPELDGEIHPINIIQPTFRANTNACLQSNPQIELASANASAQHKQTVQRWQRVADFFERSGWTESERNLIFDAVQCDGAMLVEMTEETSGYRSASAAQDGQIIIAAYKCRNCPNEGTQRIEDAPDISEGMGEVNCPQCGGAADGLIKRIGDYQLEQKELEEIELKHRLIPFYNYAIDRYGAKLGGIRTAKWLQTHDLFDRAQIEADYPEFMFGAPDAWCYQLRASYALADNDWSYLNFNSNLRTANLEFDKIEVRDIYLADTAYKNYVAPGNYEFRSPSDGEICFRIKRGQLLSEALDNASGFKFRWTGEDLLDIVSSEKEQTDFRRKFADVHWLRDSSSYLSSPNYSIKILQDDITLCNTMNHNIAARNAVNPVYYRSDVFEKADFSQEYIGTKNSALLENGDISKSVVSLPVPSLSPQMALQLQFLWQVKDSVSQVQPAMRGEMQKGETYGAQRQQLEQSYGLLTSVLKSFAACKVELLKHKMNRAKDVWTMEQFQAAASAFGEIWTDEDVQEMCELDFERDCLIDYRQGSEMPQSDFSRELKFNQGLNQMMGLVSAGVPLPPDKLQKVLQKIDEFAEFDFDLSGLETAELVSQKRILELQILCRGLNLPLEQIEQLKQTPAGMDAQGAPISAFDLLTEEVFYKSTIRFNQYEDLGQQKLAFIESLNAETGKTKPNYMYIEFLSVVIGMLDQAVGQMQEEAMANDPQVKAQIAAAEAAKADEEKTEQNRIAAETQKAEAERQAQNDDKAADFAVRTLEAEADHERAEEMAKIAKKENNTGEK